MHGKEEDDHTIMGPCECLDPFHKGKPCNQEAADHGTVIASPALCMRCLFTCDLFNGEKE